MAFLSSICRCFLPSSSKSDDAGKSKANPLSSSASKSDKSSTSKEASNSSGAPIIASYYPLYSQPSRL